MLRLARPDDGPRLAELHRLGWQSFAGAVPPALLTHTDASIAQMTQRWTAQVHPGRATTVVVDERNDHVLGFISWGPTADPDETDGDEIWDLWVDPDRRSHGIGAGLLRHALVHCRRPTVVWVLNENSRGLLFYGREGARWDKLMRTEPMTCPDGSSVEITSLRLAWR